MTIIKSTRLNLRRWRVPLALSALLVLLQIVEARSALEYRRTAVFQGELWRVVTGSLVHIGWLHLSRDVAGLLLIWALVGQLLTERCWLFVLVTSAIAVGLGLLVFNPRIEWYVGISGVLFGMFCAGALAQYPERPRYSIGLIIGMSGIIAWTWYAGALPGETAGLGGPVVPQAHLYGALGGLTVILMRFFASTRV